MGLETIALVGLGVSAAATGYSAYTSRQTAKEQKKEIKRQRSEALTAKQKLESIEKLKAQRLAKRGSQLPSTILSGKTFSGINVPATVAKQKLLGA